MHASLSPLSGFPRWRAGTGSSQDPPLLASSQMGFATWGGVMTYAEAMVGVGLERYMGGIRGGPLLLFEVNKTRTDGLVMSPANSFFDTIMGLENECTKQEWRSAGPTGWTVDNATDFFLNDLGSLPAQSIDECAQFCWNAPMCTCFGYNGPSGEFANKCWLKRSTRGKSKSNHVSGHFCSDLGKPQSLSFGFQPYLQSIPPGTAVRAIISPQSQQGPTGIMKKWGDVLRKGHKTFRSPIKQQDLTRSKLSYWTDNGGYYDGANPMHTSNLTALMDKVRALNIPVRYIQLDPYWFAGADGNNAWYPRPDLYPGGLKPLRDAVQVPLLLYHFYWDSRARQAYEQLTNTTYDFVSSYQFVSFKGTRRQYHQLYQLEPQQAYQFYKANYQRYLDMGVIGNTEVDFMNWQTTTIPHFLMNFNTTQTFWAGMAQATLEAGIPFQYCMSVPANVLAALDFPAVTNARASPDDTPQAEDYRYRIGYTSMFMWSLDIAPFIDNLWSSYDEPGNPYNLSRHTVDMQWVSGSLTAGPLGFSDGIDYINASRILPATDSNGTLLHPDKPATPIDAMYSPGAPTRPAGEVWQSHTIVMLAGSEGGASSSRNLTVYHVFAVDVQPAFELLPHHLYPYIEDDAANDGTWMVTSLRKGSCRDWSRPFAQSIPLQISTNVPASPAYDHDLYTISPVFMVGQRQVALVGETAKTIRVSNNRIQSLSITPSAQLRLDITGGQSERVSFSVLVQDTKNEAFQCITNTTTLDDQGLGVLLF
eukprot:m.120711 g.120711  ORF g.120711 m.120711 type:complete len:761 (+) comp23248_c0_seq1:183-2465(+)